LWPLRRTPSLGMPSRYSLKSIIPSPGAARARRRSSRRPRSR
jgi:hypothetical protein